MSAAPIVAAMRARRLTITAFTVVTVAAAVATAMILPPSYEATANILLDLSSSDPLGKQVDLADPVAVARARAAALSTAVPAQAQLRSLLALAVAPEVALKAVRDMGIADSPEVLASWHEDTGGEGDPGEWLADRLARSVRVSVPPSSLIIQFTAYSSEPKFAAVIANAFSKAFVDLNAKIADDVAAPQVAALASAAEKSRGKLQAAWKELGAYQREHGITTISDMVAPSARQMLTASSLLTRREAWDSAARQQAHAARGSVEMLPNQGTSNPAITSLTADLTEAAGVQRALEAELGSANPQVVQARQHVAELQRALEAERGRLSGVASEQAAVTGATTSTVRQQVQGMRQDTGDRLLLQNKGQPLLQKVILADSQHQYAYQQWQDAITRRALADTRMRILNWASPPARTVAPNYLHLVPGSLVIGLMLGFTVAWIREQLDARVRAPATLERIGLPLLGQLRSDEPWSSPSSAGPIGLETGNAR